LLERKDNFESISKESFILVRAKHQGEVVNFQCFDLFTLSHGLWLSLFSCY